MYPVDPPPESIPKNLSDALVEIARNKVYLENLDIAYKDLKSALKEECEARTEVQERLDKLLAQMSAGWLVLATIGAFTLGCVYFFGGLKTILSK